MHYAILKLDKIYNPALEDCHGESKEVSKTNFPFIHVWEFIFKNMVDAVVLSHKPPYLLYSYSGYHPIGV